MTFVKGEALRQSLLISYCCNSVPFDTVSKESTYKTLTRQATLTASSLVVDSDRGSLQLSRAGMTLHDVQVCHSIHSFIALLVSK